MKFKVIAYTFSVPLLWATLLFLKFALPAFGESRFFSKGILIGLLIASLIARFIRNDKYLTDLSVDDEKVTLIYLTSLGKRAKKVIPLSILTDIKMKRKMFLVRDFGTIRLSTKDNELVFDLLNSSAKENAEQLVQIYFSQSIANNT